MTLEQLRAALEAWRAGDDAALRRAMNEAQATADAERVKIDQDAADVYLYGIGPMFIELGRSKSRAARHEFDIELIRKPNGSYGL